jgi:hypothetical protein
MARGVSPSGEHRSGRRKGTAAALKKIADVLKSQSRRGGEGKVRGPNLSADYPI